MFAEAEIAAVEEGLVDLVCSTLDEEQIQTCAEGKNLSQVSISCNECLKL